MTKSGKVYGFNTPQRLFVGYTLAVLVDLVVLNFFDEYWDFVNIESFTISLIAALLLKLSIGLEHKIAEHFKSKPGTAPKVYRAITTYIILMGSKFVMLEAINLLFGDKVSFTGPWGGVVAFFAVVFTILVAEVIVSKIYFALDDKQDSNVKALKETNA
ncbi:MULTISPECIES: hypothetical protein [unclassified Vibrio]|uniref:hypothetical protein n=1 Tax=unclassified Vibrio TaxID=2614977 RepID=UPI000C81CDBF|nr:MULTISPECIES: hypothetical protein [unclassified Vibrio]PMK79712.1 hypothetical protein BCT92_02580 [Vibrio sp. 10N.261.52.E5]TKF85303.1 hypothetical protein FCV65_02875 [Vibrio sp. F13]